jgi:delta 1-pyrroline-5-carboxylate dehydrogenase
MNETTDKSPTTNLPFSARSRRFIAYQGGSSNKMENTLKRLLSVETEAEQLVAKTQTEREQIIQQALQEAHQAEQQFKAKIPELKAHFLEKTEAAVQLLMQVGKA